MHLKRLLGGGKGGSGAGEYIACQGPKDISQMEGGCVVGIIYPKKRVKDTFHLAT